MRVSRYDQLPTGIKIMVLLSLALLPLGLVLVWAARDGLRQTRSALADNAHADSRLAASAIEGIVARNALALRVAANGTIGTAGDTCETTAQALALTPAIASQFSIRDATGKLLCVRGAFRPLRGEELVAPGAFKLWISPENQSVEYRVGVTDGSATGDITREELAAAIGERAPTLRSLAISDSRASLPIVDAPIGKAAPGRVQMTTIPIGNGQLVVHAGSVVGRVRLFDNLATMLPMAMWVVAVIVAWLVVRRLLLTPLARLERAVVEYEPGSADRLVIPEKLGSAREIRSLGRSFERAVDRIEHSEQQMAEALHGQRRLVREVHHRVKNNLQVIASMLNIHGRSAETPESNAAYASIGRRVDALSVVHRNHFAEVEESRGIALRPLLSELAGNLRSSAPADARGTSLQLDLEALHTTQDAAVAVAFFVTEVAEYAMLQGESAAISIELRRISELMATLTVSSELLAEREGESSPAYTQFQRVIGGLARQLRSPLEQKFGRISINLPVFPE